MASSSSNSSGGGTGIPLLLEFYNDSNPNEPDIWHRDKPGEVPMRVKLSLPPTVLQRMKPDTGVAIVASICCERRQAKDDSLADVDLAKLVTREQLWYVDPLFDTHKQIDRQFWLSRDKPTCEIHYRIKEISSNIQRRRFIIRFDAVPFVMKASDYTSISLFAASAATHWCKDNDKRMPQVGLNCGAISVQYGRQVADPAVAHLVGASTPPVTVKTKGDIAKVRAAKKAEGTYTAVEMMVAGMHGQHPSSSSSSQQKMQHMYMSGSSSSSSGDGGGVFIPPSSPYLPAGVFGSGTYVPGSGLGMRLGMQQPQQQPPPPPFGLPSSSAMAASVMGGYGQGQPRMPFPSMSVPFPSPSSSSSASVPSSIPLPGGYFQSQQQQPMFIPGGSGSSLAPLPLVADGFAPSPTATANGGGFPASYAAGADGSGSSSNRAPRPPFIMTSQPFPFQPRPSPLAGSSSGSTSDRGMAADVGGMMPVPPYPPANNSSSSGGGVVMVVPRSSAAGPVYYTTGSSSGHGARFSSQYVHTGTATPATPAAAAGGVGGKGATQRQQQPRPGTLDLASLMSVAAEEAQRGGLIDDPSSSAAAAGAAASRGRGGKSGGNKASGAAAGARKRPSAAAVPSAPASAPVNDDSAIATLLRLSADAETDGAEDEMDIGPQEEGHSNSGLGQDVVPASAPSSRAPSAALPDHDSASSSASSSSSGLHDAPYGEESTEEGERLARVAAEQCIGSADGAAMASRSSGTAIALADDDGGSSSSGSAFFDASYGSSLLTSAGGGAASSGASGGIQSVPSASAAGRKRAREEGGQSQPSALAQTMGEVIGALGEPSAVAWLLLGAEMEGHLSRQQAQETCRQLGLRYPPLHLPLVAPPPSSSSLGPAESGGRISRPSDDSAGPSDGGHGDDDAPQQRL